VGRRAQALGVEAGEVGARRLRLVAKGRPASVEVSGASGALVVSSRLDREELCGKSAPCTLRLEVLVERPLRVFHVELEVTDINDNAPRFPVPRKNISVAESSLPGSRFPLEGASDADIGANAQLSYKLSPSEHFALELKSKDGKKTSVALVLMKSLDREAIAEHRLLLTASDGGRPSLSGTMELVISVLDANDNAPEFNQTVYKVQLPENTPPGKVILQLTATDKDEGVNQQVSYAFSDTTAARVKDLFRIDPKSGEVSTVETLDFEDIEFYDLEIEAKDWGALPLLGHCSVEVEVLDVNDNAPEVWVTSLSVPVSEDAPLGTVVALLSVSDRDSGSNGRVRSGSSGSVLRGPISGIDGGASPSATTNVWLVVAICAVSSVFLLAVVLYAASRWSPRASVLSGPGPTTLVCASEVGSWSYSQRQSRSVCVAEGAGKSDLMVFSPNFPPPAGSTPKETPQDPTALLDTVSGTFFSPPPPFPSLFFPSSETPCSLLPLSFVASP
ncbi:PREDICTED: protocadherin alpha-5-like, partial [Tinamus guttatus]|uniref:protocadherin alpha-5-like n=1 Tax=Tinamus guttatus TaxID=94827 RepID=UPI00052ED270